MKKATISLKDLQTGSDETLAQVYEENRDSFIYFAARYGVSREDSIDIYQDTFIAFYNNIMSGRIKEFTSAIPTYIMSIGKHKILDELKKRKRTVNPDFDLSILQEKDGLTDQIDLDKNEQTYEQQQFYTHFETLGTKCKELLHLFYFRGHTIADIMALGNYNSENVIKSTKSRCLKTLKERISTTPPIDNE